MADSRANQLSGPIALCFGEMLWDALPRGLFPGGAPMNVAYHLSRFGVRSAPVSAVGRDVLGDELLRRVRGWGLETSLISVREDKPTGLVRVHVDGHGPAYTIAEDVAWDWIDVPEKLPRMVEQADALIYGSLAQRAENNRKQLQRLFTVCKRALKVFDVNLRAPYDPSDLVWSLAKTADVIKLNDDEVRRLLGRNYSSTQLEQAARDFSARTNCPRICITAGSNGAGLLLDSQWFRAPAEPVQIKDTVGAGDSFLAALVNGLLTGKEPAVNILTRACRLAEFVASSDGATPAYTISPAGAIVAS